MNKEEFIKAVDFVAKEKGISKDIIFEAMELALLTAYKKNFDSKTNARVDINRETGEIKVYKVLTVVDSIDEEDPEAYAKILESDAYKIVKGIKVGETIEEEITPKDFGRVATSTAKQVMTQKLREAERESIMSEFEGKQDELLVGQVSREDGLNYYIDLGRAHGILPKKELIPGEKIEMGSSIKVYVTKIEDSKGPLILLSRNHFGFVKRLLEHEVPEFSDGTVKLYSVARDAGSRSKVAVYSDNPRVDAIGACIGEKGSRIANIMEELNGEKLDIVLYDKDPVKFIKNALSPAKDVNVLIMDPKENSALAIADGEQLSLAIGKKGQNVRLASRLTKYKIDVKTSAELKDMGINIGFEG